MKVLISGEAPEALISGIKEVGDSEIVCLEADQRPDQAALADVVLWYPATLPEVEASVGQWAEVPGHIGICTPVDAAQPVRMYRRLQAIADAIGATLIDTAGFVASYRQYGEGTESDAQLLKRYIKIRLSNWLAPGSKYSRYYYGAATYPEVWGLDIIRQDIQTMKALNMNFTRIGEFMWQTLEPEPGRYDFALLDQALAMYEGAGIDVLVCTPTPTPPRWLTYQHPERCVRTETGAVMVHGSRQHVCTNNDFFRDRAYRVTRELMKVVARHHNVVGIQLDNEFKCHVNQCFCDTCQAKWHDWLATTYQDIATLNQAWGTQVWSEAYADFDEVPMPEATPFIHNAALANAFQKFTSATVGEFAVGLSHIIRQYSDKPITHNSSLGFNVLNRQLFAQLDTVGFDTYAPADQFGAFQMNLDMYRNVKPDTQDFMLLETSTSHAGHIQNYVTPHPEGYLVNEAFLGFAAGLRTFDYWHFRQHRFGVEQPHAAVVTAWGDPDINMEDVKETGAMFEQLLAELAKSKPVKSSVAMLYSDDAKRFYQIDNGGYYQYRQLVTNLYQSLLKAGIDVELVQESSDLTPFAIVLAPFIRHVSETLLGHFKAFVAQGGKLLLGPMTGDRTQELALPATNGLGRVGQWLGFEKIRQFSEHDMAYLAQAEGVDVALTDLITVFDAPKDWRVLLTAANGQAIWAAGTVAAGEVMYLGALPADLEGGWWQAFIQEHILPATRDYQYLRLTAGLVQYRRDGAGYSDYYIANMTSMQETVHVLSGAFTNSGEAVIPGEITIPAFDRLCLRRQW